MLNFGIILIELIINHQHQNHQNRNLHHQNQYLNLFLAIFHFLQNHLLNQSHPLFDFADYYQHLQFNQIPPYLQMPLFPLHQKYMGLS